MVVRELDVNVTWVDRYRGEGVQRDGITSRGLEEERRERSVMEKQIESCVERKRNKTHLVLESSGDVQRLQLVLGSSEPGRGAERGAETPGGRRDTVPAARLWQENTNRSEHAGSTVRLQEI